MTQQTSKNTPVEALELARLRAMVAADIEALDDLLHDGLLFGHTNGHSDDKGSYLAKFKAGTVRYFDADHSIDNANVFGPTAFVRSRLSIKVELATGILQLNVIALTVWANEGGRWRMVAHQPTVIN